VGIDYRGGNYLYGLADVIRVVRVDFTNPRVNVVSLPRALLVDLDENWFRTEGPALLNQAYFFGTPGMGKYLGEGDGAGALGQTLQYNFGITPDHYLVMNFDAFVGFIDAIGGIEVDLPEELKTPDDEVLFPAGKQWLDGEQALQLARIRKKYSDLVRINHQTLILLSVFRRLQDPAVLANLPAVIETLRGAVVTDVTPQQVSNALCVLVQLEESDLHFSAPPGELIRDGEEYIPSLRREMQIFTWDEAFTRWMQEALADGMP
jgi:LCP family protein required for cell wall assembly